MDINIKYVIRNIYDNKKEVLTKKEFNEKLLKIIGILENLKKYHLR